MEKKIFLILFLGFMLINLIQAETTFFDNPDEFFIMKDVSNPIEYTIGSKSVTTQTEVEKFIENIKENNLKYILYGISIIFLILIAGILDYLRRKKKIKLWFELLIILLIIGSIIGIYLLKKYSLI